MSEPPPETPTGPELGAKHSPPSWGSTKKKRAAPPQEIHFHRARGFPIFLGFPPFFFWLRDNYKLFILELQPRIAALLHGKKPKKKALTKKYPLSWSQDDWWFLNPIKTMGFSFMPLAKGWNQFPCGPVHIQATKVQLQPALIKLQAQMESASWREHRPKKTPPKKLKRLGSQPQKIGWFLVDVSPFSFWGGISRWTLGKFSGVYRPLGQTF